jgi:predicted dehydrogenase
MLQSRRYSRHGNELPATLRRSCQEAQDTFTTLRDSAVRVYGETDQADRAGAARAAGRVQQSLPLVDPQRLRVQSGQLRGYRDAEQAPVQIRRPGVHGGIFRDCAVHDYDAVRWVTGQEVAEVYAAGGNRGADWFRDLHDADTASAILTLADGALAVVSNSRYNARGYDVRLELHGSRDSIAAGWEPRLPMRSAEPDVWFPDGEPYTFFMDRFAGAFRAELAAFTEVVAGRRPSPCPVADAIETGWVAEACTLSLRERRPIRVAEVRR